MEKEYNKELRLTVVKENEAAEHFNIKQGSTIANWQRAYDTQGFEGLNGPPGRPKNKGDRAMTHQDKQP